MTFVIPDLTANRNALLMANLSLDPNACLSDKEMAAILPAEKFEAYKLKVAERTAAAEEAKNTPATVGAEGDYYWSAAKKFIEHVVAVQKMATRTVNQKTSKRGAEAKLPEKAEELLDLWRTVPDKDRACFRKLIVDGVLDHGLIPGVTVGKSKVKASRVQQYAIWVIESEYGLDQGLQLIPWLEQLEALEAYLGKEIADHGPVLTNGEVAALDELVEARQPRPDDVDATAVVKATMARLRDLSAKARD